MHRPNLSSLLVPGLRRAVSAAPGLALLVAVVPASAASGWVIQPTPNPTGATVIQLTGVSCTAATACTAVGFYGTSSNTSRALAERWNGASWKIQLTPNPAGATFSGFNGGVSCATATACTAVGSYEKDSGPPLTLAERWNGTSWKIQPTPNPSAFSSLLAVSCTTATACTAVGEYLNSSSITQTLAERWNGTSWKIQPTPNATAAPNNSLRGVSCTTATACTAVGSDQTNIHSGVTLAERWNGTSWKIQPTPNPTGATFGVLNAVSCTAATACTAAGYFETGPNISRTLAERWNGTSWKIQPTPNPTGALFNLTGVSCTAATACTTAGYYSPSSGGYVTLAERWTGTSWKTQPTPNPTAAVASFLKGVSCTAATACTAAGYFQTTAGYGTLAEREG